MNRSGCRRRLERERAHKRWASSAPSSATEGEAAEEQPPARTRVGARALRSVTSAFRHGCAILLSTESGLNPGELHDLGVRLASISSGRLDSAGDEARLISGYRVVQLHGGGLAGGQTVTAPAL